MSLTHSILQTRIFIGFSYSNFTFSVNLIEPKKNHINVESHAIELSYQNSIEIPSNINFMALSTCETVQMSANDTPTKPITMNF